MTLYGRLILKVRSHWTQSVLANWIQKGLEGSRQVGGRRLFFRLEAFNKWCATGIGPLLFVIMLTIWM